MADTVTLQIQSGSGYHAYNAFFTLRPPPPHQPAAHVAYGMAAVIPFVAFPVFCKKTIFILVHV